LEARVNCVCPVWVVGGPQAQPPRQGPLGKLACIKHNMWLCSKPPKLQTVAGIRTTVATTGPLQGTAVEKLEL